MIPWRLPLASVAVFLTACSPSAMRIDAGGDGVGSDSTPPSDTLPPMMACRSGAAWTSATPAFTNTTGNWGLSDARATSLAVADMDGDGYPDLVTMTSGLNRTQASATPPVFHTHVFYNRPRAGGGRTFVDQTDASNFLVTRDGMTGRVTNFATFVDIDNDGDADAWTGVYADTSMTQDPGDRSVVLLNDGQGHFSLGPFGDATPGPFDVPQTTTATFLDYDRDGNVDLLVGYYWSIPLSSVEIGQQHQLFQGTGDGHLNDVTMATGLMLDSTPESFAMNRNQKPLQGWTACDLNGDNVPDLVGAAYGRQWNLLYVSQNGHYTEQAVTSGVGGDGNQDYWHDQSFVCFCHSNPTHPTCTAHAPLDVLQYACPLRGWTPGVNDQPWRLNGNNFTIACGDIDNDGDMDLYTSDIAHPDTGPASDRSELLINDGTARFTRPGRTAMGLVPSSSPSLDEGGLSSAMFDFDGDGTLDIWLGNSDYPGQFGNLFHQDSPLHFSEVSLAAGWHHACPLGIAIADFDRDGDLDVVQASSTARSCAALYPTGPEVHFYENQLNDRNFTSIRLAGTGAGGANRMGIGARVRVTTGSVTQTREVLNSWGRAALATEPVAHFGLGDACTIDRIEVRWPDTAGTTQTFTNVVANYGLEIHQGDARVHYVTPPR